RRALVPVAVGALLGGHDLDELVEAPVEEAPAALHVADEAVRLVLRADVDAADARIDAVREREVDDAELAAEGHGRLRAPVGELLEAAAPAAREHHRYRILRRDRRVPRIRGPGRRPWGRDDPLLDEVHHGAPFASCF